MKKYIINTYNGASMLQEAELATSIYAEKIGAIFVNNINQIPSDETSEIIYLDGLDYYLGGGWRSDG